jgi:purine-binding chemotaxis protein CheW
MTDSFDLSAFLSEVSARLVTSDALSQESQPQYTERARAMIFRVGAVHYAIPLQNAAEVLRSPAITPVPGMPAWVAGVINRRGTITSVVDFARFLGKPTTYSRRSRQPQTVIVMQAADQTIGMIVDSVESIMTYPADAILSPIFDVEPELVAYLRGVLDWQDQSVRFLDCTPLLTGAQMQQFT